MGTVDKREEIRVKLKKGYTIDNICKEYKLSFNDLLEMMKFYNNPIRNWNKPRSLLYISERNGRFFLRKSRQHYGVYKSVEDAFKVRDYFMVNGWDKSKIDTACKIVGVERVLPKKR